MDYLFGPTVEFAMAPQIELAVHQSILGEGGLDAWYFVSFDLPSNMIQDLYAASVRSN